MEVAYHPVKDMSVSVKIAPTLPGRLKPPSHLWQHFIKLQLKTNMQIHLTGDPSAGIFASQLLQVGEGRLPVDNNGQVDLPFGKALQK